MQDELYPSTLRPEYSVRHNKFLFPIDTQIQHSSIKLIEQNVSCDIIRGREAIALRNRIRKILFRIRWAMMSERSKYDYLWTRVEEK